MEHWNFWEWLAYSGLWVAGIVICADGAIKMAPTLRRRKPFFRRLIESRLWLSAPLAFVIAATIILLADHFDWLTSHNVQSEFRDEPPRNRIVGKNFINERVVLDGNEYVDCTFENVTFVYNGIAAYQMRYSKINGFINLSSENKSLGGLIQLLGSFGFIDPRIRVVTPPGIHIEPIIRR